MSFKEFKPVCSENVAGPQIRSNVKNIAALPSTSLTPPPPLSRVSSMYTFITETYRELQSYISGINKDLQLIQTINKYKKGCNEVYIKAFETYNTCYQMAQNISRTIDIFKELCTCLPDLEEYNYRLCEILSIFIACELRLSADASQQEQPLIAQRIIYIMRRHLVQVDEHETIINILRTLVYIPKLFDAREIMCAIFGEFIPLKPVPEVNVLPDRIYMLYIIVFYRWMMMQKDDDDKLLIVNFAESFMKPSVSLCSNKLYGAYLPMYTKHSTATRTILNNLTYYRNIRNACIIDNALKKIGAVVNLCDDDEDDIIFVNATSTTDFAKIFDSICVEPLSGCLSNVKLEEETVVDTVDLTAEEEALNSKSSIHELHDKWLNDFQKLAKQYRESQLILEKQQNKDVTSNDEKRAIICLDSDSEEESEEFITVANKETPAVEANKKINHEDLFVDSYPLTNTPLNCESDLEFLNADDENDVTKISPRFLSSNLRTYQAKKSNLLKSDDKNNSGDNEQNKLPEIDKAYRRDSLHISSTPPEEEQDEEDEGTDVQDENDDITEENDEDQTYTSKIQEKELFPKEIRPMGPYPTYNNMHNEKVVFSQNVSRYSQHQHHQQNQYYHSDNSELKTPKKQKKRVQFNKNILGPTVSSEQQKNPLKPALQQTKYKDSDALDYYHLRGFERFSSAPSVEDSASTTSSTPKQDHFKAAPTFFRRIYPPPISPSPSSVSSRSLTSPAKTSTSRKKSNKSALGVPLTCSYDESSDDFYGVLSDSDIAVERYRNDAKLFKRCEVVITPSKEMLQYEFKQNQMYNEILKKQRRKLELRALEKQREKERRRVGHREDIKDETKLDNKEVSSVMNDKIVNNSRRKRNCHEIFMSSESEYETTFQVRTRKLKTQNVKDLEPLKVQIEAAEHTTTTLLRQIDIHLDKPASAQRHSFEMKNQQQETLTTNHIGSEQTYDISTDKSNTKMRELNLLADIAQHLSPYQIDIPEKNPPRPPSTTPEPSLITETAPQTSCFREVPKEKVIVIEQLFLQSIDNLLENQKPELENNNPQKQASSSYAHEANFNKAAIFKSSTSTNLLQNKNHQNNTHSEKENNDNQREEQTPKIQDDKPLEQILEESISVLTEPSPCNSTIPILISNVESLNQFAQSDIEKQNSEVEGHLLVKNTTNSDSENVVLSENLSCQKKEKMYNAKDVIEENNVINESPTDLSFNVFNNVKSSIMCVTDLVTTPRERQISKTFNVPLITAADLSDISLESEISKHLPEIAEPSPVVTDMSDSSNESNVSKSFDNIHNCATNTEPNNEICLPDLSMIMPNINQASTNLTVNQQDCLQTNFNHFNNTLNTPVKHITEISRKTEVVNSCTTDLNTPLKLAVQSELDTHSTPLKNSLESETDNNVTQFLDLILNKTVSDAESETRDKIIKELNALTTDAAVVAEMRENTNNSEKVQSETSSEKPVEANNAVIKKNYEEINLKQNSLPVNTSKLDKTTEYNSCMRKEKNSLQNKNSESEALKELQLHTPSENIKINPPNASPSTFVRHSNKIRTLAEKQTFNIKCRVRLKRLNIDDYFKNAKIESLPALSIDKPDDVQRLNNYLTECDTATGKTIKCKKPCLKTNTKHASKEQNKITETTAASEATPNKKPKFDSEKSLQADAIQTQISQNTESQTVAQISKATDTLVKNITIPKPKSKPFKTVTFDLSNLNEELRDNTISSHKQKSKIHAAGVSAGALGCFLKNSRTSRKLPDNTLRAAETLQMFVNTINASTRTPPPAEFNKKRSPIKNKCIAEDETPRPPPASTLMGTPPCKKSCTEKSRSHLTSKCKDQLVSSLTTPTIQSITSDITTARIYTSSPLDQTLPEYDDNVDTVADSELILPTTTGSLRRKLKRPKKSLSRPEPTEDLSTDDIVNQPDCNGEDDTEAAVDNEDDVFAEELLPIPSANEHILEEIVSTRPTHIGTSTAIRDDYMSIEATATVPVYLFNDESRELGSPEVIQSSDYTNIVDSSSYLNTASTAAPSNIVPTPASTTSTIGNLEKSMLSPSEHEVSSTQETFYQTPIKNKQTEIFGEKSSTSKEKGNGNSGLTANAILKQKSEDNKLKKTEDYQTSSTVGLLQNNQVDTTNHSPEMCTVALTSTTTTTTTLANNRKMRKPSTHDEILFNELQQQLPSSKRKSNSTTFCVESTSDNSNNPIITKVLANNLDDTKTNRSLAKVDDKFKKLLKEVCTVDKEQTASALDVGLVSAGNNIGGGGSSPSTTTTINEESLSRSKRKKLKSSKSKKSKNRSDRSSKISLKPSKLTPHLPANPLIITISKSRLLRPPTSPPTPTESRDDQQQSDFLNIPNANLFIEKIKGTAVTATTVEKINHISLTKKEITNTISVVGKKSNSSENSEDTFTEADKIVEPNTQQVPNNINCKPSPKGNSGSSAQTIKKKEKLKIIHDVCISNTTCTKSSNNLIFAKDKYDLIKSKDKHYNQQNQEQVQQEYSKDKSKEKVTINLKSLSSNISRSHKGPTKERVRGEKLKEKHRKTSEKSLANQTQPDNVLKITLSQNNIKSSSPFLANLPSTAPLFSSNLKQGNSKSSKSNSTSSSSISLSIPAILKSKTNSSTTHLSDVTAATGQSQATATTLSTNNVRKKLKIK